MNYRIKDYFKGSKSQLISLGKQATQIYRLQYRESPPKVEDKEYGEVNVYPEEILEKLEKPIANKVTDVYLSPIVVKGLEHGWNYKYRLYNEYEEKLKNLISGELITDITIEKISWGYKFLFNLKYNELTLHISMNNNYISRNILSTFIKSKVKIGDKIRIKIFSDEDSDWCKTLVEINDKIISPNKNIKIENILEYFEEKNNKEGNL